ncbi:unnamed protein product [Allacma fusca]|uniref:Uncharacterized protein n=1 Tax=Allacma fusca TaxID=39272 RepID=A0A8J2NZS2_9HEXA|nr:unnamed protein product [Allacma fusca]
MTEEFTSLSSHYICKTPSNPRDFFARLYENNDRVTASSSQVDKESPSSTTCVIPTGKSKGISTSGSQAGLRSPQCSSLSHLPPYLSSAVSQSTGSNAQLTTNLLNSLRSIGHGGPGGTMASHLWSSPLAHLQWNFIQQLSTCTEISIPPALNGFRKFISTYLLLVFFH